MTPSLPTTQFCETSPVDPLGPQEHSGPQGPEGDDPVARSPLDDVGQTLQYKSHPIRVLQSIDGVPWFAVRDLCAALNYREEVVLQVLDYMAFPASAKRTATESPDGEGPATPDDIVLLSPVGVFIWGALVDPGKTQNISAWAKRESRRLCPTPTPGDPAMFLTIFEREDGLKALPPKPLRYSGWASDFEELRWCLAWSEAEEHNHKLRIAQLAGRRAKAPTKGSDIIGDMERQLRDSRRQRQQGRTYDTAILAGS